eukprot:jgi/Picre1/34918/NNA_002384.t1
MPANSDATRRKYLSISSYVSANRDLVLGMCRIFALVATTHPLKKFAEALMEDNIDLPDGNVMLINLGSITNAMVYDVQRGNDACEECLELLVEMWTEYSSDFDLHGHLGPLYEQFCQCTSSVFNALKDKELYEVSRDVIQMNRIMKGMKKPIQIPCSQVLLQLDVHHANIQFPH